MIKKFKLYILLVAVAFSTVSCLDKMPDDSIPFDESIRTVDDVNLAVIGIYDTFKSSALYSGNLTLLPDLQTDFVYGVMVIRILTEISGGGKISLLPIQVLRRFMPHYIMLSIVVIFCSIV